MSDKVFLQPGTSDEFRIFLEGRVHAASFNSRGAALAGLAVEKRRIEVRRTAKDTP